MLLYRLLVLFILAHLSTCKRKSASFQSPLGHISLDTAPPPMRLKEHLLYAYEDYEYFWNIKSEEVYKDVYRTSKNFTSFRAYKNAVKTNFLKSANIEKMSPRAANISDQCLKSMIKWFRDDDTELYAMRMWDSWGTLETGVLEGNVRYPGHYHECKIAKNEMFSGKWCMAYYGFLFYPGPPSIPIDVTLGNCLPSTCADEEIKAMYNETFKVPDYYPLLDVLCTPEPTWETVDTICAVVVGIITALCLVGTSLDLIQRYMSKPLEEQVLGSRKNNESIMVQLAMPFSVISNGEKIIDMKRRPGTLPVLDGLRFISTTWVVLGHTLQMMFYGLDNTVYGRRTILNDPSSMVVLNAFFSVDSFFFLSGLLVAYLGMKHIVKQKGRLNIFLMYLQRYLRLTPLYAFLILFHMSLYKYLGTGPFWVYFPTQNYQSCKDNWWTNLVYINNLYPVSNQCFSVAWYLANDMQFYILAPIFIFLLYRNPIIGIFSSVSVIVGSTVVNGVLTAVYELQPTVIGLVSSLTYFFRWYVWIIILSGEETTYADKYSTDIYNTPWSRIHVYMIGMLTGYILHVGRGKIRMNKVVAVICWTVTAAIALFLIYAPWSYVKELDYMELDLAAAYNALGRPLWGLCMAWVVLACSSGYGGPVTTFLNWKLFTPLSRLTYSTYLAHIYVLYWFAFNQDELLHYLTVNLVYYYLASLILSFGVGFILSVTIEWPFVGLCKLVFNPSPPKMQERKVIENTSVEDTVSETSSSDSDNLKDEAKMREIKPSSNHQLAYENQSFQENGAANNISTMM